MLVMYLCVMAIDVRHAFVCYGYRCWLCNYMLGVSMLFMYLCVSGIYVGLAYAC